MKYTLLILFVLMLGCKQDVKPTPIVTDDLLGKWNIYHVTRNGKVTKTLENGFFVFQADNTVESNIFPEENNHTFKFEQNKIAIEGLENLNNFKLKSLENDTMILETKINVFDMTFYLSRN